VSDTHLLALDIGGSGCRALLFDPQEGSIHTAARPLPTRPTPGTGGLGVDLDLETLLLRLRQCSREVLERSGVRGESIAGIAATSMRFGNVVLDTKGEVLLAVPNRDARAAVQGLTLAAERGEEIQSRTGHWPLPIFSAARLQWLAAEKPEAYAEAATVLSLSDWLGFRLSGEIASEATHAGGTLLFDLEEKRWADDLIESCGLARRLFPAIAVPGSRLGTLGSDAAEWLGLRPGVPVALGAADTQCGLLGTGATQPGDVCLIAGTTAPLMAVQAAPALHPEGRTWAGHHLCPGAWVSESNAGPLGEALAWFARCLYPDSPDPVGALLGEASLAEPGAGGILSNVGATVMNARDQGIPTGHLSFSHLSSAHEPAANGSSPRGALARSAAEGLACAVRANLEQLRATSRQEFAALRIGGGLSRSDTFVRILASTLGSPLLRAPAAEATGVGTALLAGVGAGLFETAVAAAQETLEVARVGGSRAEAKAAAQIYERWCELQSSRLPGSTLGCERTQRNLLTPFVIPADPGATHRETPPRPRILVTAAFDEDSRARLAELGDVEYASFREKMRLLTGASLVEALQEVQIFVTEVDIVDAAALEQLPDLRAVVSCRGDAVNVDIDACTAFGVPVLNAPGRNADAVAELTLAYLLMLGRKLLPASAFLHDPSVGAGDMGKMGQAFSQLQGRELFGRTIGLVGLGAVGRAVAARLRPFGARVLACDPYFGAERAALAGAELVSFAELLEGSDVVSLHAAVTDETRNLMDAEAFARMREGAAFINTARAALVDEQALIANLESGRLAGAALDAFAVEPPGADHPLLQQANVIATPHVGGNTIEVARHQGEIVVAELERLLAGEAPRHVRNPETLARFRWTGSRPAPDPERLAQLASRPGPAVSDLQRERKAAPAQTGAADALDVPAEIREGMSRLLSRFVEAIEKDEAIADKARDEDVLLCFTLTDLGQHFHFALHDGAVTAALGLPAQDADVNLSLRAAVLDGMFTGTLDAMEASMQGEISFQGDAAKAMTMQHLSRDLNRLYTRARQDAGDPGDLASIGRPGGSSAAARVAPGDIREDLVATVHELYAAELITATGGNVSVRIPDAVDQLWITPSQLFKGDLAPEVLVRLDLRGEKQDPAARAPSSEWNMHCAVLRAKPEAKAVIHAHAPNATILVNSDLPWVAVSTEAAFFKDLPRIPFVMPGTPALAEAVEEAMRHSWAVLMKNHGILVAGRSLRRAADMAEIIERSAQVIVGCHAVGREPPSLPEDVIATLSEMGDLVA